MNTVGLGRHGYTDEQISRIKEVYRLLFRSKLPLAEALARVRAEVGAGHPEVEVFVDFVARSQRGVTR